MIGVLVLVAVLWVAHTAAQHFVLGVDRTSFMRRKVEGGFVVWATWRPLLTTHVSAAIAALALGVSALSLGILRRNWAVHGLLGKGYAVAVLVAAAAGLPLSATATGGPAAAAGFVALNIAWLATTWVAYRSARSRRIDRHRAWAARSYAVTLANMTLHVLTAVLTGPFGGHAPAYAAAVWLCWPTNLAVAEVFLRAARGKTMISVVPPTLTEQPPRHAKACSSEPNPGKNATRPVERLGVRPDNVGERHPTRRSR